jgi:2-keto-4-pentenoate hydratase/2-oxohepta-3-ene-1,7-dioic acid hydratase in catechol pathway
MRIIRFLDEKDKIFYGHKYTNGSAVLLSGGFTEGFIDTGCSVRVKKILAPVEPPAVLCIGLNYRKHAAELNLKIPDYPVLFMKNPASVIAHNDDIIIPKCCADEPEVDYEIELTVVIGKTAKDVSVSKVLEYIAGYTVGNDVSARHWQMNSGSGQWVRGKSFDTFCPLGPELVTPDEITDPQSLQMTCLLNGNIMQKESTSDMIFSIAEIVSYLSRDMTLLPGTVILTGTPGGVGYGRKPPVYLKHGDMLELKIDRIGTLRNMVKNAIV